MNDKRKDDAAKILNKLKYPPSNRLCFVFSQVIKISARIKYWTHRRIAGLLSPQIAQSAWKVEYLML